MRCNQPFQLLAQQRTFARNLGKERGVRYVIDHRASNGASQWVSAVGRSVRTKPHATCRFFRCQNGTNWETAPDALGHHHNVRVHSGPFMRKEFACTRDTALHFIKD